MIRSSVSSGGAADWAKAARRAPGRTASSSIAAARHRRGQRSIMRLLGRRPATGRPTLGVRVGELAGAAQAIEMGEDLARGKRPGLAGDVVVDRGEDRLGVALPLPPGGEHAPLAPEAMLD